MAIVYIKLPIYFHTSDSIQKSKLELSESIDINDFDIRPTIFKADSIDFMCKINFFGREAVEFGSGGKTWKTPISEDDLLSVIDELTSKSKIKDLFCINNN
jgi:hypothetical protein